MLAWEVLAAGRFFLCLLAVCLLSVCCLFLVPLDRNIIPQNRTHPSIAMMKTSLGLSLLSLLCRAASAQDTASSRAETALHVLQDWYNPSNGIWDTCGWWNGANCMTVIGDLALVDGSEYVKETALEVFNNTFHVGPGTNPYAFKPPPAATQTSSPTATSGAAASPTSGYWGHNPKWVDGSFDDDGWWALAWITAYDNTHQQEYLNTAIDIYESLVIMPLCRPEKKKKKNRTN